MSYPGGKSGSGIPQRIINLMPPHRVYIEPFLGGGAIMRLKRPAALNIGIDLVAPSELPMVDGTYAHPAYPAIVDRPHHHPPESAIVDRLRAHPPESASSAEVATSGDVSSPTDAAAIHCPGCGSRLARRADARIAALEQALRNAQKASTPAVSSDEVLPRFEFHQGNGIQFLEDRHFERDELIYCDPPYLPSTRSGRKLYRHEMTNADHRRLLRAIRDLPCMVMISGYYSQMYAAALRSWNAISYEAMTRGGPAVEWLWFNFPAPVALHDYRYLGANFRERERIKRQKARWTARLLRMPPLQRQALLAAIAETDFSGDAAGSRAVFGERIQ